MHLIINKENICNETTFLYEFLCVAPRRDSVIGLVMNGYASDRSQSFNGHLVFFLLYEFDTVMTSIPTGTILAGRARILDFFPVNIFEFYLTYVEFA